MLLVVGNLVYDWIAGPVTDLCWDQTAWPEAFAAGLGGNGGTTAYAAARQGARVRLVTGRGDDEHGAILDRRLRDAGVDTVYVPGLTGSTALTMGLFRADGARALFHRPGVLTGLFSDVETLQPYGDGVRWLHVANPFAVPGLRRRAAHYLREAKAAGWTTSMDLGWDRLGEWMTVVGPCLPYCDWLLANAAERAEVDLRDFAGGTVVKQGAGGCTVNGAHIPGVAVRAVDSTGAGDCFCGGFLAAMQAGATPADAARVANVCGARSVSAAGPTSGFD